ncbi:MAG: hypothetical protein JW910_20315, partial [Anaerolineae bacterium]|nr:hypothetical protein [Anaerolineae bacterium]
MPRRVPALLSVYRAGFEHLARPVIFLGSAQTAHDRVLRALRWADGQAWLLPLWDAIRRGTLCEQPVMVGGVSLPVPVILAAGFVKGDGFASEQKALDAVAAGRNIMPGWRCMPRLAGPVEFGSFTRWPRLGNPGIVVWRDAPARSTQNRVGLKNPGARAAARFLAGRRDDLPPVFGINIAVSPGVADSDQEQAEVLESAAAFLEAGIRPAWLTLNLSCPNTEDDPGGNQTEDKTRRLCGALVDLLGQHSAQAIPLWVKVGPDLDAAQYHALLRACAEVGVRAVVATNTLGAPTPTDPAVTAGVGGGRL